MSTGRDVADALQARLNALMDKGEPQRATVNELDSRLRELRNRGPSTAFSSATVREFALKADQALASKVAAARDASGEEMDADGLLVQIAAEMAMEGDNRAARTALAAADLAASPTLDAVSGQPPVSTAPGETRGAAAALAGTAGRSSLPVIDDALLERLEAEELAAAGRTNRTTGAEKATAAAYASAMTGADEADAAAARLIAELERAGFTG